MDANSAAPSRPGGSIKTASAMPGTVLVPVVLVRAALTRLALARVTRPCP